MKKFNQLTFKERNVFLSLLHYSKVFLEWCKEYNVDNTTWNAAISFIQFKENKGFFWDTTRYFDLAIPYEGMTYYDDLMDGHSYATYYEE